MFFFVVIHVTFISANASGGICSVLGFWAVFHFKYLLSIWLRIHVCAWLSLINWLNWMIENFNYSECLWLYEKYVFDTNFYLFTGIQPLLPGRIWIQNDKTRSWFSTRNQVHNCCFIHYYFDLHYVLSFHLLPGL